MRTIRTKIYRFDELSKEAKEKAIDNIREERARFGYMWEDYAIESLRKFAKHFNCELKKYSIDWGSAAGSYAKFLVPDCMEDADIKGYIESMGSYDTETLLGYGDCNFTGYSADEDAADGAREAFYKDNITDVESLLKEGFNTWIKACVEDYEYSLSDEAIMEYMEPVNYEFYIDGRIYHEQILRHIG